MNVFNSPCEFKEEIVSKVRIPTSKRKKFDGKSFICVFFTKFCNAGCPFCFFKSDTRKCENPQEKFEFSDVGFEKFIKFLNESNNGYLLVSGGGEPFEKSDYVMKTVSQAKTDRIVIVTSGIWAQSYDEAKKIIFELYDRLKQRNDNMNLILRLSLDKFHYQQLGFELVNNIFTIFKENFKDEKNFQLQLHTMIEDDTIDKVINKLGHCYKTDHKVKVSDNDKLIKIVPERCKIKFDNGYEIPVGMAKIFYPNLRVNLSADSKIISKAIDVFKEDMKFSEYNNPSVVTNTDNSLGFDFWINYNANVTTWGNQQLDNLNNLYLDNYDKIVSDTYNNVISYSFLDKGYHYRESIINEVNPKASLRAKAVNIRDYAGALILEEKKTGLYYALRSIQDYMDEGIISYEDIKSLSPHLISAINMDKKELKVLYDESNYTILSQYIELDNLSIEEWIDLFTLINLGHYDVSEDQIAYAMNFVSDKFKMPIKTIMQMIKDVDKNKQYGRLIERITFMKSDAEALCRNSIDNEKGA